VVLVLDRSSSMGQPLTPSDARAASRWEALGAALVPVLGRYQSQVAVGALLFPSNLRTGSVLGDGACRVSDTLDVPPATGSARAITTALGASGPTGSTPTAAALERAGRHLLERTAGDRPRALILATDGWPNCGAAGTSLDGRVFAVLARLAEGGVPTYVLGLDDPTQGALVDVLNRLAEAGQRPRRDAARYYSVRQPQDLSGAFDDALARVSRCTLALDPPAEPTETVTVALGARTVLWDPAHRDGWDYADPGRHGVLFHGPTCDTLRAGTVEAPTVHLTRCR
jgi:hypothetical protein